MMSDLINASHVGPGIQRMTAYIYGWPGRELITIWQRSSSDDTSLMFSLYFRPRRQAKLHKVK